MLLPNGSSNRRRDNAPLHDAWSKSGVSNSSLAHSGHIVESRFPAHAGFRALIFRPPVLHKPRSQERVGRQSDSLRRTLSVDEHTALPTRSLPHRREPNQKSARQLWQERATTALSGRFRPSDSSTTFGKDDNLPYSWGAVPTLGLHRSCSSLSPHPNPSALSPSHPVFTHRQIYAPSR